MEPILIEKNKDVINATKKDIQDLFPKVQAVYNGFKGIGIEIPYSELKLHLLGIKLDKTKGKRMKDEHSSIISHIEFMPDTYSINNSEIEHLVRGMLVDKIENPEVAGMKISKVKLKELIELPDLNNLTDSLEKVCTILEQNKEKRRVFDYYEIVDGVFQTISNYENIIESRWSYYAKTDNQILLTQEITKAMDALNNYYSYLKSKSLVADFPDFSDVKGLEVKNSKYRLDCNFILSN
jgi:hypothetical protein